MIKNQLNAHKAPYPFAIKTQRNGVLSALDCVFMAKESWCQQHHNPTNQSKGCLPCTSSLVVLRLDQCLNNMKRSTGWSGENREISSPLQKWKYRIGSDHMVIYLISVAILCWACMLSIFLMSLCRAWKSSLSWEEICVTISMTRPAPLTATISTQLNWAVDWTVEISVYSIQLILIKIVNE